MEIALFIDEQRWAMWCERHHPIGLDRPMAIHGGCRSTSRSRIVSSIANRSFFQSGRGEGGDSDWSDFALQLAEPPQDGVLNQVLERSVEEALQGKSGRSPFDTILPPAEAQGQGNSAEGLGIPLGQAGMEEACSFGLV